MPLNSLFFVLTSLYVHYFINIILLTYLFVHYFINIFSDYLNVYTYNGTWSRPIKFYCFHLTIVHVFVFSQHTLDDATALLSDFDHALPDMDSSETENPEEAQSGEAEEGGYKDLDTRLCNF